MDGTIKLGASLTGTDIGILIENDCKKLLHRDPSRLSIIWSKYLNITKEIVED